MARDTSGTSLSGPDNYDEKYWRTPQPAANRSSPPPAGGIDKGTNNGQ